MRVHAMWYANDHMRRLFGDSGGQDSISPSYLVGMVMRGDFWGMLVDGGVGTPTHLQNEVGGGNGHAR